MKKTYVFPMISQSYVLELFNCEALAQNLEETYVAEVRWIFGRDMIDVICRPSKDLRLFAKSFSR